MRYYFAPMEGLTDGIYRRLHCKYFPGITQYYTPFFSPTVHRTLTPREARELPPAGALPFTLVPQILTKNAEDFLWMARQCRDLGYGEVNLNAGCPSGTVTAKGKGAGLLRQRDQLDAFLSEIFRGTPLPISVKTRIGYQEPSEFPGLLEVFNRYPIQELIVHPRVRNAFYQGSADMDAFRFALENSRNPICYNGNLCSASQIRTFTEQYPQVGAIMLGRGLVGDPGMLLPGGTRRETLMAFHEELMDTYQQEYGGPRNAIFRMKENWHYMIRKFENSDKLWKKLRKTTDISEFRSITRAIFETLPMLETLDADW